MDSEESSEEGRGRMTTRQEEDPRVLIWLARSLQQILGTVENESVVLYE